MRYDLILSVKPCYAKEILCGNKKYEFRKSAPKRQIRNIYIYETSPTKKIIGYFEYNNILVGDKNYIWNTCSNLGGIMKADFFSYYDNSLSAYAYFIEEFKTLSSPINPFEVIEGFVAPQSYRYIEEGLIDGFICNLV